MKAEFIQYIIAPCQHSINNKIGIYKHWLGIMNLE